MNKAELIESLAREEGLSNVDARRYVELFFDTINESLAKGERVEIRGLCIFKIKEYKGYAGRNPKTGELVKVKPKRLPFFKPGADLKQRVNK